MSATVVLEWKFSPPDYFESQIEIEKNDYTMTISNGKAEARIDSMVYDANPLMRDSLHRDIIARFQSVLLCSHEPYKLERPTMTHRVYDDGRKDYVLEVEPMKIEIKFGKVDISITTKDGIIIDDKRDRIEKKKAIADLVSKHDSDGFLLALLQSYENSVRDPDNEFFFLYEIRDALYTKFGNKDKAISKLDIPKDKWNDFGKLCNEEPVKQSRHRGKHEAPRNATEIELSEVRETAKTMIEAYLRHLDKNTASVDL